MHRLYLQSIIHLLWSLAAFIAVLLIFLFAANFNAVPSSIDTSNDVVYNAPSSLQGFESDSARDRWMEGKILFRGNCGACHKPDEDMTGPALAGIKQKWIEHAAFDGKPGDYWLYEWIRNWQNVVESGHPYALEAKNFDPASEMQLNQGLDDEDIDLILEYIESGKRTIVVN